MSRYDEKKQALVAQFKKLTSANATIALDKKTSNLFRHRQQSDTKKIDVKHFNQVISIDPHHLIADVEAMITFEDLVAATLPFHCLPPVVPQLKTITVGGALVGLGIEASSFRYGLVHESILEIEVLTSDGEVLVCRPDNEHRDLFFAFPNSYGTLGYALRIKLKLIAAKPYVRMTNLRVNNFDPIGELCSKDYAYIDGVVFDKNEMYVILGEFVDEAPFVSDYTYMNVYYQSIREMKVNYLTTHDFIWRWDADWFWCSKHFGMNNKILRFLFGKFLLKSSVYSKISRFVASHPILRVFEKPSESVIQDVLIPIENAPQFLRFLQREIGITPIWICPFKPQHPTWSYTLFPLDPTKLYIDFGFWDIVPSTQPKGTLNRLIEDEAVKLNGYKSLYSDSFYTEEEFWRIHSKSAFDRLKAKYDSKGAFKNLYEKCVHSRK